MTQNLLQKLFEIQAEIGTLKKTATNDFYDSNYLEINALLHDLRPLLEKHKLVILQPLTHVDGAPAIKTMIVDLETGQELSETTPLICGTDAQKHGASITYHRRFALISMLCLETEDDDAESVVVHDVKPASSYKPPQAKAVTYPPCEKCGGEMKVKSSSRGPFLGCANYTSTGCKNTRELKFPE